MNPLVQTQTVDEIIKSEEKTEEEKHFTIISSLSQYVEKQWADAKDAKQMIEDEMLESVRQRRGEYDPTKLAEIKSVEQPEIFLNITDTKCRNAVAWAKDILFTGDRIFGVDPTIIPDLPPEMAMKIQQEVLQNYIMMVADQIQQTGQQVDPNQLRQIIVEHTDEIKDKVKREITDLAKKLSDDLADKIDDDWTEGGFYKALEASIDDLIGLKAGIIKGPVFRKVKVRKTAIGPDGRVKKSIETKIVPQYERRSPFCIYPFPHSTDIEMGGLFDVIVVKPKQLFDLIGVDGYNEKEIRDVLREFYDGKLTNDWLNLSDSAKEGMGEDDPKKNTTTYPDENIFCLELWDEIDGKLLKEWGLEVEDEDDEYSCCVWKIGTHVIKAMLNYDMLGRKPFSKASFQTLNDSFWGQGLPEVIADCQQVCNACARSILANIGMGALPQTELNVDRLQPNASQKIFPGKIWYVTEEQMAAGSKAVNFFQPVMVTEKLINVYTVFSRIADEHSGVPAYAHGDAAVGGAGSTSSGLHQLIQMAARGIKAVIRNVDLHIIVPSLERHYDYLLDNQEVFGLIGDYNISAKGTSALIAKEQLSQRKIEFLNNTANPIDLQIVGETNRRKMLYAVAKSLGIELDENELPPVPQQVPQQQAPQANPQTLDQAGNPAQGAGQNQFAPSPVPIQARAKGGPVQKGKPYLVGEKGPELIVPDKPGTVIPNQNGLIDQAAMAIANGMKTVYETAPDKLGDYLGIIAAKIKETMPVRRTVPPVGVVSGAQQRAGELSVLPPLQRGEMNNVLNGIDQTNYKVR